ncbi:unnamed protein product [Rotaria magnacalcarata]|uniref:chitin synthase n=1 Tax=Rotaria magnacalcarata TaxID=392030 RepID=A0A814P6H9_9BILA|nr:unnamed protein product [Rotaria magnacalcarata]
MCLWYRKIVEDPIKISTPYGGRSVWLLPGKNRLIVHVKHKYLIRYKKPLDCDVDFKLEAVLLLVDRMRKNRKILAVCGQIHPTGDGILLLILLKINKPYLELESTVWYIVCCLRCFLLSRASSLMDDNVMRRYANKSTETVHYDQGENRWLKTLLIEQVYRVEYCDASDAYTHAQETFKEFFNQHRHWMSSTIVNIMDLLKDTKHTKDMLMKLFQNYVLSSCFFISTMLRRRTILLRIASILRIVFSILTIAELYTISLLPALFSILIYLKTKADTQITIAAFMTG